MGVWIETSLDNVHLSHEEVTPYVGVWIETPRRSDNHRPKTVTPYVGVWIETSQSNCSKKRKPSHTLRGCVD